MHGLGSEILNYTIVGLAQGFAAPIVGGFAGRFLPLGQFNAPAISIGTGWLLSKLFGMFGFTRRLSHPAFVFGAATAAMQILTPFVGRLTAGVRTAPTMSGPFSGYRPRWAPGGLYGIGMATGTPPLIVPPPLPPAGASAAAGMQGVGMRTGNYGY